MLDFIFSKPTGKFQTIFAHNAWLNYHTNIILVIITVKAEIQLNVLS